MDLNTRLDELELMDTQSFSDDEMREMLKFLAITNKYFGGTAVVLRFFERWSRKWAKGETIRVLDVGTGGADIPLALLQWAKRRGIKLHITAIDTVEQIVRIARSNTQDKPEIFIEPRNIFDMPTSAPFDYVIASLFLHHIPPAESVRVMQKLNELTTRGLLISDLHRSWASYAGVSALSHLIGNKIVQHDGPLSVRRSFRLEELTALAKESNAPYLSAGYEPWFRVTLAGEKPLPEKMKFAALKVGAAEWLAPSS